MSAYDLASIGALSVLNLLLLIYIFKGLKRMSANQNKSTPHVQSQLLDTIRNSLSLSERSLLIQNYNSQFAASDIKILNSKKIPEKIRAMRRLSHLGETQLYEIKKLIDDTNDSVAMRAFHLMAKRFPEILSIEIIRKMSARCSKHRALFSSSLLRISRSSNYQVLIEVAKEEMPPWISVLCLKALTKVQAPDLLPLLLNAQDHSSEDVRNAANAILNQNPLFQKFAT